MQRMDGHMMPGAVHMLHDALQQYSFWAHVFVPHAPPFGRSGLLARHATTTIAKVDSAASFRIGPRLTTRPF
jgi:hypothetical protein